MKLLHRDHTGIIIVDAQEKLMEVMGRKQRVVDNIIKLIELSKLYELPIVLTEQYPKWLGPTLPEIQEHLQVYEPISKIHFNCCDVDAFNEHLNRERFKKIVLTGVESHICVFQTCTSLLEKGYEVHIPQDAVDSRTDENWRVGLGLMSRAGGIISSTESIIYQLLQKAGTKEFKKMLKLVK